MSDIDIGTLGRAIRAKGEAQVDAYRGRGFNHVTPDYERRIAARAVLLEIADVCDALASPSEPAPTGETTPNG